MSYYPWFKLLFHSLFEFNPIRIPKNNQGESKGKIQEEQQDSEIFALHWNNNQDSK